MNREDAREKEKGRTKRVAMFGMMVALAMILSYVEALIPISFGIPGVKPGLANLVVFAALYVMSPLDAFCISVVRILLVGITFGNMFSCIYSLTGGILSYFVMLFLKEKGWLTQIGVSIAGGISHNIGQLIVAAIVVESAAIFSYFPVLLAGGAAAGTFIGILGGMIIRRVPVKSLISK